MGRILGPDGKPLASDGDGPVLPELRRQPPALLSGRFTKKQQFEAVCWYQKQGSFQYSTWLADQMMTCGRVASAMQTRTDKLTGTKVSYVPGRNNDLGRRAARMMEEEDAELIAPATARAQMCSGALVQGVRVALKHWYVSPTSGRGIPQIEPWSNFWLQWDWSAYAYRMYVVTPEGGQWRYIQSPSVSVPGEPWRPQLNGTTAPSTQYPLDDPRLWVVSEPYGVESWRDNAAMLYSMWEDYFGYALANNDMNSVCEQQGRGQRILEYPKVDDSERPKQEEYIGKLVDMGSDAVIPLEQQGKDLEQETVGYKLTAFEYPSNGHTIIVSTKESNAAAITIRILGHNTQGETKGAAGAGGGAATGSTVRGDIGVADTLREFRWRYQVHRDWAGWNFGDAALAPIPLYDIEDPATSVQVGQAAQFTSAALAELHRHGVDTTEYLRRARFPLRPETLVTGWTPPPKPPSTGAAPLPTSNDGTDKQDDEREAA